VTTLLPVFGSVSTVVRRRTLLPIFSIVILALQSPLTSLAQEMASLIALRKRFPFRPAMPVRRRGKSRYMWNHLSLSLLRWREKGPSNQYICLGVKAKRR
jgi:hypothetical protein